MTRSSTRRATAPECHSLNFFCDDEDGCAFTTLVKGYRFHIIADAERLRSTTENGKQLERKYLGLVRAVTGKSDGGKSPKKNNKRKRVSEETEAANKEQENARSQDSAIGSSPTCPPEDDDDTDSAVDVEEADGKHDVKEVDVKNDGVVLGQDQEVAEKSLQNWMLEPFAQIFQDLETSSDDNSDQTIQGWYTGPTYFYILEINDDKIEAVEQESQPDLEERMKNLIPRMSLPKTLRDDQIPWIHPSEAVVVSESNEPDPYHPSRVKVNDKVHFFKAIDMTQPQPTKRELKIMKEIEKKGLHKKIRVPLVTGLVGFENSKTDIMGFLMTDIDDPTPLTKMLDTDVIEDNREKWAKESKRMVDVLHENDIIWGDAKADNFLVDKHGDLWIIDFGGSYTDGWVDPDLMETIEGDDMGTEKIVNALEDPEGNTYDPDDVEDEEKNKQTKGRRKRSREEEDDDDEDESYTEGSPSKRRKS